MALANRNQSPGKSLGFSAVRLGNKQRTLLVAQANRNAANSG